MLKKPLSIILSAVILLGVFVIAPISASARVTFDPPTAEEVEEATAKKNFPKPENLRVVDTTDSSVTVSWKYEKWGYNITYTTDPDEEPKWEDSYTVRQNDSTDDWEVTVDNLTLGKTYYIYVQHATIDVVGGYLTYLGGEYSMVKVKLKADNPITVKTATKSVKASALKKAKKIIKPLTISRAKGTVKVTKVKSGTTAKIYSKITVAKKTGAVTFKKGTYKKGTYKVKLKVTAAGNSTYKSKTVKKTVKIKIK